VHDQRDHVHADGQLNRGADTRRRVGLWPDGPGPGIRQRAALRVVRARPVQLHTGVAPGRGGHGPVGPCVRDRGLVHHLDHGDQHRVRVGVEAPVIHDQVHGMHAGRQLHGRLHARRRAGRPRPTVRQRTALGVIGARPVQLHAGVSPRRGAHRPVRPGIGHGWKPAHLKDEDPDRVRIGGVCPVEHHKVDVVLPDRQGHRGLNPRGLMDLGTDHPGPGVGQRAAVRIVGARPVQHHTGGSTARGIHGAVLPGMGHRRMLALHVGPVLIRPHVHQRGLPAALIGRVRVIDPTRLSGQIRQDIHR